MILGNILAHSRSLRQASCGPYYSTTQTGGLEVLRAPLSGGLGRVQKGDGLQLCFEGWGATSREDTVCAGVRQGRSLCVSGDRAHWRDWRVRVTRGQLVRTTLGPCDSWLELPCNPR